MKIFKLIKGFAIWCGLMGVAFVLSSLGMFFLDVPSSLPLSRMAAGLILLIVGFKIATYEYKANE